MKLIYNSFGCTDEQAMIDQFFNLHGRDKAENLDRIYRNHCYSKDWTVFALREGFSQKVIDDFKQLM